MQVTSYKLDKKRYIAAFDFDGTLTRRDSLLEFLLFTQGRVRTYLGLLLLSPAMMLMFLGVIDNNRCKEIMLSHFFKGMKMSEFQRLGKAFAERVCGTDDGLSPLEGGQKGFFNPGTCATLGRHLREGHEVYIISASVEQWVKPIAQRLGVENVLCTRLATDADGRLTGRYQGRNCHGQEKVNRLLEREPERGTYCLYAYGDSGGDREMLSFADEGLKIED